MTFTRKGSVGTASHFQDRTLDLHLFASYQASLKNLFVSLNFTQQLKPLEMHRGALSWLAETGKSGWAPYHRCLLPKVQVEHPTRF